jgi:uncharacterized protein DUF4124
MAGLLVASTAAIALADGIYKSVDAQGHVVFSDRPSSGGAQKTQVAVQQADPHEAARLAQERMLMKAEDDQRKKQENVQSRNKAQQEAIKKELCKSSRDRYDFLKSVNRLYVPGGCDACVARVTRDGAPRIDDERANARASGDGNREYYTDAQLESLRADAKRTMNAACGT